MFNYAAFYAVEEVLEFLRLLVTSRDDGCWCEEIADRVEECCWEASGWRMVIWFGVCK